MAETQNSLFQSSSKKKSLNHKPKKLEPLQDQLKPGQLTKIKPIHSKRDLIDAVRKVTSKLSHSAPLLDISSNLKTGNVDNSGVMQQLALVEIGVIEAGKKYNDLHMECDRKTQELKQQLDVLDVLKAEYESLSKLKKRETAESQRIVELNAQIDELTPDIAQKTHYLRQLEHILTRLEKNQIRFDAHLNGMEEAHKHVERECWELELLRKSMDASLVRAHFLTQETNDKLEICRKEREIMLAKRRGEMKAAQNIQAWMHKRELLKVDLAMELRGDLTKEERALLQAQLREKEENTRRLQKANEESQKKMTNMEEAFMLLKQITGVSSLDEMVEKFSNQRINKKNLEKDVRDTEMKLAEAKRANQEAEDLFQQVKASETGAEDVNRERLDKKESDILSVKSDLKAVKAHYERLNIVLVALHQGAQGLLQRVNPYRHLVDSSVFELTQTRSDDDESWAETMDALSTAEQCLSKLLELLGNTGDASPTKFALNEEEVDDGSSSPSARNKGDHISPPGKNNIRVMSRRFWRGMESGGVVDLDVDTSNDFDITSQEDRSVGGSNGDLLTTPDGEAVMSRGMLKKSSMRTSLDAVKKADQASRRKRMAERASVEEVDEKELLNASRLKAQQQMAQRLAGASQTMGLPEGITMRDGPLARSDAFLKQMPKLA